MPWHFRRRIRPTTLSLALVADLASQMDAEAAVESGLTDHLGGLDEMVVTLTAGERGELRRLLKDELAKS